MHGHRVLPFELRDELVGVPDRVIEPHLRIVCQTIGVVNRLGYSRVMDGLAYLLLDEHGAPIGLAETLNEALTEARRLDPQQRIYLDAPTEQDFILVGPEEEGEPPPNHWLAANVPVRDPDAPVSDKNAPQDALRSVAASMGRSRRRVSIDRLAEAVRREPLIDFDAAMTMPLEEAHRLLQPIFPRFKYTKKTRTPVLAYERALGTGNRKGMAYHILGQNFKTQKKTPASIITTLFDATGYRKANVLGLSLLPTKQSFENRVVLNILSSAPRVYGVEEAQPVRLDACVRASAECASSCLVFSGRNLGDDYNTVKKYALTASLVRHPEAFVRMLVENIRLHYERSLRARTKPLVRLNVFSDLPWELMVPGLFEHFGDQIQFYDYTKIPNRKPPPNYDLTFSFSGTDRNVVAMDDEIIVHKRRVAIVFAAVGLRLLYRARWQEGQKWHEVVGTKEKALEAAAEHGVEMEPMGRLEIPATPAFYRRKAGKERKTRHYARLPEEFLGLEVIDGDVSDMRPYDPAPSIVGLRWKNPANQGVTLEQAKIFIVLVHLVPRSGGYYDAIVSKTARFDDVDYAKYAPSVVDQ